MWPSRPPDGGPLREPSFPVKKSHFPSLGSDRGNRFNCRRGAADEDELPACLASIKNADENLSRIRKAVADFGLANTTDSFVTAEITASPPSPTTPLGWIAPLQQLMSYGGAKIARPEGFHVEVWPMTACRLLSLALTLLFLAGVPAFAAGMDEVKHLIIIYGENRSFDNLYGLFPNAEGIATAEKTQTQLSKDGKIYEALPQPINTSVKPPAHDTRFPANLPNKPFDIAKYVPIGEKTGDLVHRYWHEIEQIDGGKMDKFAAWSDAAGLAMGYYDGSGMALWKVAQKYTLADHFFHGAFGGSFLNHVFFVWACTPRYENAPASLVAKLDANGHLLPGPDVVRPMAMPSTPCRRSTNRIRRRSPRPGGCCRRRPCPPSATG